MCRITVHLFLVCNHAACRCAHMPVSSFIIGPLAAPVMLMLVWIIICVMEYDLITVVQILLDNTEIRMFSIQSVHPSTVFTICEFGKFVAVFIFCNSLYVIAGCISECHSVVAERFFQYIQYSCICINFISGLRNPCLQISGCQCMTHSVFITVMLFVA